MIIFWNIYWHNWKYHFFYFENDKNTTSLYIHIYHITSVMSEVSQDVSQFCLLVWQMSTQLLICSATLCVLDAIKICGRWNHEMSMSVVSVMNLVRIQLQSPCPFFHYTRHNKAYNLYYTYICILEWFIFQGQAQLTTTRTILADTNIDNHKCKNESLGWFFTFQVLQFIIFYAI